MDIHFQVRFCIMFDAEISKLIRLICTFAKFALS